MMEEEDEEDEEEEERRVDPTAMDRLERRRRRGRVKRKSRNRVSSGLGNEETGRGERRQGEKGERLVGLQQADEELLLLLLRTTGHRTAESRERRTSGLRER